MKYTYNEKAFMDNTEMCYYFLGFISADGCLSDNGTISINISNKDIEILDKLKQYLLTDKPIFKIEKTNSCLLSFKNNKIYENILKFGLTPRKSLTLMFPKNIPEDMIRHYIRGYFDGDGCISIIKGKNTIRLRINLVGTYNMIDTIQKMFINKLNIKKTKVLGNIDNVNTFQLNIKNNNDVELIKKYLYEDSTIFLTRKRNIFFTDTNIKNSTNKTTSKYKNVCFRKRTNSWSIFYYDDNKRIECGGFKTEDDAYDNLCKIKMELKY